MNIALVYPPYGPSGLPSLGLGLLSAGIKKMGFACDTFYWNLDFIKQIPGRSEEHKWTSYRNLSGRPLFPVNEWVFSRGLFPVEHQLRSDRMATLILGELDGAFSNSDFTPSRLIPFLREQADIILASMVEKLAFYDLIGISTSYFQNIPALALAQAIKKRWPEKKIVLGGANCEDVMGPTLLQQFTIIDFVFSGEADQTFPDFIQKLSQQRPLEDIPGLSRRDDHGQVITNPAAAPLRSMDDMPTPDFDDFVRARESSGRFFDVGLCLALEASRGCWWGARHHCTFCGLNANGMQYRQKSWPRMRREIQETVQKYRPSFLFFTDNMMPMSHYRELRNETSSDGTKVELFFEIKSNVNRKRMAFLARSGVSFVQPGIESFSSSILTLMNKGVKGIDNVAFLKYAREYGILASYNLLVALPGEQEDAYIQLAREIPKLRHLRPPNGTIGVEFHRFSPYHSHPDHFGIKLRPLRRYQVLYPFPEEIISKIAYLFERDGILESDFTYLAPMVQLFFDWRRVYREETCLLTWGYQEGRLVIRDRRDTFPPTDFFLMNGAIQVFHHLDAPLRLPALREKIASGSLFPDDHRPLSPFLETSMTTHGEKPKSSMETANPDVPISSTCANSRTIETKIVSFSREEFLEQPMDHLDPLIRGGLLFVEEDWILALPVYEKYLPYKNEWFKLEI
ncbi:MAG: RiPP maturation radical SAM C-methyltransferase [Magnetococcales bacterium]|nr:RiPP maturation radical SAM C-methyltransferase [Magnetococcales bacterium]